MLRNYFKIAFRNLIKDKFFSLINILGFQNKNLTDAQITQINQLSAKVLREMVGVNAGAWIT